MQVDTNVSEGDVGRLQVGMKTYFTVDSFPGQRFLGKIRQIRNAATTVQNVVTYDAVIDVDNTDLRLRPGMTANVTVIYAERKDVLAVSERRAALPRAAPTAASGTLRAPRPAGSCRARSPTASRAEPDGHAGRSRRAARPRPSGSCAAARPSRCTIHTGLTDGTVTEVVDGLNEGDAVIVDVDTAATAAAPRLVDAPHLAAAMF